jgi:uncharacterized membrane protein
VEGLLCGFIPIMLAIAVGVAAFSTLVKPLRDRIALLERQSTDLNRRLKAMEAGAPPATLTAATEAAPTEASPSAAPPDPAPSPAPSLTPTLDNAPPRALPPLRTPRKPLVLPSPEKVAVWIGASLGALALVIGALLGLVAVAEAGWFGPALRVAAGLVAGTTAWVVGASLRRRWPIAATALSGAGIGAVFGAVFAATSMYDLVSPTLGFVLLVAVVVAATAQADRLRDRFLSWLAVGGGLLAPVLVSTGDNGAVGLFTYLFLLSSGLAVVASRRDWPEVIGLAALGDAVLYLGWTASWRDVDSQAVALIAAVALAVPFAVVAASRRGPALMLTGVAGAAVMSVVALPWIAAIDPTFYDPRSGEAVVSAQSFPGLSAIAVAILPLPLWLAARRQRAWWMSLLATGLTAPAVFTWSASWGEGSLHTSAWHWLVPLLPLATGVLVHLGDRRTGTGLLPLPLIAGSALAGTLLAFPDGPAMGAAVAGLIALCALGAFTSAPGALLIVGAVGALFPLHAAIAELGAIQPGFVLGGAMLTLGALAAPALVRHWPDDPIPVLPWIGALALAPAAFLPLYGAWLEAWDDHVVGLLPLLLAAWTLLGALVLVRRHRVDRHGPVFALAIAIVLAGITFALPIQVESAWLTVGWALEGAALAVLTSRLRSPLLRLGSIGLGAAVAVRLLLNPEALSYGSTDGWFLLNWTLYTWGIPTITLLVSATWLQRTSPPRDLLAFAPTLLRALAVLTGFALVNVEVSDAFQDAGPVELGGSTMLQGMVRSLSWGAYGMLLLGVGLSRRSRATRFAGFAFVLLGAAKVFVYDMWSLPGFIRVGSLLGLGMLLLVAAFLFERLVLRPDPEEGAP